MSYNQKNQMSKDNNNKKLLQQQQRKDKNNKQDKKSAQDNSNDQHNLKESLNSSGKINEKKNQNNLKGQGESNKDKYNKASENNIQNKKNQKNDQIKKPKIINKSINTEQPEPNKQKKLNKQTIKKQVTQTQITKQNISKQQKFKEIQQQIKEQTGTSKPLFKWEQAKFTVQKQQKPKRQQFRQAFQIQWKKSRINEVKICLNLNCSICQGSMAKKQILAIPNCNHTLHKQCITEYISIKLTPPYQRIKCPFGDCQNQLKQSYLRQYLPSWLIEKYWEYESNIQLMNLITKKILRLCPQNGCKQIFLRQKQDKSIPFYICKTTSAKICKQCNITWHWRIPDCKQFAKVHDPNSSQYNYLKLAKEKNWMQCSKCLNMIQKNEGCIHIKCMCGYDFCYACGGPFPKCQCPQGKKRIWHNQLQV